MVLDVNEMRADESHREWMVKSLAVATCRFPYDIFYYGVSRYNGDNGNTVHPFTISPCLFAAPRLRVPFRIFVTGENAQQIVSNTNSDRRSEQRV